MARRPVEYISFPCSHCAGYGRIEVVSPKWLREKRESKNVRLREVARLLGYSASYLSDVELGRRKCNDITLAVYEKL